MINCSRYAVDGGLLFARQTFFLRHPFRNFFTTRERERERENISGPIDSTNLCVITGGSGRITNYRRTVTKTEPPFDRDQIYRS